MRRILFVDDEVNILMGLQNLFRRQRKSWDMVFVTSGEHALRELRSAPFDVVVSDMRMPGMDGSQLFGHVKEEFPSIIRIIMSGHAEREAILRAMPVSHQFLSKPCEGEVLRGTIDRMCQLQALLDSEPLRSTVLANDDLISPPAVYPALVTAIQRPDASARDVAAVLERDPAVCAELAARIEAGLTPVPVRGAGIETVIACLGNEATRALVLSLGVDRALAAAGPTAGIPVDDYRTHAFLTARVASQLVPAGLSQDGYAAGLLHDIGGVFLALRRGGDDAAVSHAEVGAFLLRSWGLPLAVVEAVAHHHHPERVPSIRFGLLEAVHAAEVTVFAELGWAHRSPDDQAAIIRLENMGCLDRARAIAAQEVEAWRRDRQ